MYDGSPSLIEVVAAQLDMSILTLIRPDSPHLWNVARHLVEEYTTSLNLDLSFQNYAHELQHLMNEYSPPDGVFLLAKQEGVFMGCGGLRRFSDSACEMKRLYVRAANRHHGMGRKLAGALIHEAHVLGYQSILLDTLPSMSNAQMLYKSLGFKPIAAYRFNPVPGAGFLKLTL